MKHMRRIITNGVKSYTLADDVLALPSDSESYTTPTTAAAAWRVVPYLYRAVDIRGKTLSSVPWALYRGGGTIDVGASDMYRGLTGQLRRLLYLIESSLCLYGFAYLAIERNDFGHNPTLRWLAPHTITPEYEYATGDLRSFARSTQAGSATLVLDDVCYVWQPDPSQENAPGLAPAAVAIRSAGVLAGIDEFSRQFFERGATKAMLLTIQGIPQAKELEKLESWWRRFVSGVRNAWTSVVVSASLQPVVVGDGLSDIDSAAIINPQRESIAAALGVPTSLLNPGASNYATAKEEKRTMINNTIIPELLLIEDALNEQVFGQFGLRIAFDPLLMPELQDDELAKAQSVGLLVEKGVITRDEARVAVGWPADPPPEPEDDTASDDDTDEWDVMDAEAEADMDAAAARDGIEPPDRDDETKSIVWLTTYYKGLSNQPRDSSGRWVSRVGAAVGRVATSKKVETTGKKLVVSGKKMSDGIKEVLKDGARLAEKADKLAQRGLSFAQEVSGFVAKHADTIEKFAAVTAEAAVIGGLLGKAASLKRNPDATQEDRDAASAQTAAAAVASLDLMKRAGKLIDTAITDTYTGTQTLKKRGAEAGAAAKDLATEAVAFGGKVRDVVGKDGKTFSTDFQRFAASVYSEITGKDDVDVTGLNTEEVSRDFERFMRELASVQQGSGQNYVISPTVTSTDLYSDADMFSYKRAPSTAHERQPRDARGRFATLPGTSGRQTERGALRTKQASERGALRTKQANEMSALQTRQKQEKRAVVGQSVRASLNERHAIERTGMQARHATERTTLRATHGAERIEQRLGHGEQRVKEAAEQIADLQKNHPKAHTRAFGTDPNKVYHMKTRLVDLASIKASNTPNGAVNPDYDPALQPRDRSRQASLRQIEQTAKNMVPEAVVLDFHAIDRGSPIIDSNGNVLSGNGRVMALQLMQKQHPKKWEQYQETLKAQAAEHGIQPAQFNGMKAPVLVRELYGDEDRVAFAREANQPPVLQMSPLERAKGDRTLITDRALATLDVGDEGIDVALRRSANAGFVRDFVGGLPDNERAQLLRADGTINKAGIDRVKAALFTKTFPGDSGSRLAETFLEAVDSDTKSIEAAITGALPKLAKAEGLIQSGARDQSLSLMNDFAAAVGVHARLKESGTPLPMYLTQTGMFGESESGRETTPDQEHILMWLDENARKPKVMREMLQRYSDLVEEEPAANQTGFDIGDGRTGKTSKDTLLVKLFGTRRDIVAQGAMF